MGREKRQKSRGIFALSTPEIAGARAPLAPPALPYLIKQTLYDFLGQVSCGNHKANNCSKCGPNSSYCNGDCHWMNEKCVKSK